MGPGVGLQTVRIISLRRATASNRNWCSIIFRPRNFVPSKLVRGGRSRGYRPRRMCDMDVGPAATRNGLWCRSFPRRCSDLFSMKELFERGMRATGTIGAGRDL